MAAGDSYDFIVVGCGAAGLSAAIGYIQAAREQGHTPRVAVLESAPAEQRGGATRWTTARFRACEDFSLDPSFVDKVAKVSKGLADLDYCRVLEREVPTTLRSLETHGVKLLHYGPPVAMGVLHEIPRGEAGRLSRRSPNRSNRPATPRSSTAPRRCGYRLATTGALRA